MVVVKCELLSIFHVHFVILKGNCNAGPPSDKTNFGLLVQELSIAFKSRGYLLSAAVAAGKSKIDMAYAVPELSKYLDFINIMAYDLHGHWDANTGEHASLFPSSQDPDMHLTVVGFSYKCLFYVCTRDAFAESNI